MDQLELFDPDYLEDLGETETLLEYCICFVLDEDPPLTWAPANRLIITPYLERINSRTRQLEAYSDNQRPVDTSPAENTILDLLFTLDQNNPLADSLLDYLSSDKKIKLLLRDSWGLVPMRMRKISRVILEYHFREIRGGEQYFMPTLHLFSGKKNTTATLPGIWYQSSSAFYYPDRQKGDLYYLTSPSDVLDFLGDIFENAGSFSKKDILEKNEQLSARQMEIIQILPPKVDLERIEIVPTPHLEFHGFNKSSKVRLFFEYLGIKVTISGGRDTLIQKKGPEKASVIMRDRSKEKSIRLFCSEIFKSPQNANNMTFDLPEDRQDFLAKNGINLLDEGFCLSDHSSGKNFTKGHISLGISHNQDSITLIPDVEDEEGNKTSLSKSVIDKEKGIAESDFSFLILNEKDISRLSYLKKLGLKSESSEMDISRYNLSAIEELYDCIEDREDTELIRLKTLSEQINNFDGIEKVDIPDIFNGNLRSYQQAGVNWIYFLYKYNINGCLADDMGLGKTVQTLAFLTRMKADGNLDKVLIVLPVSTSYNWEEEAARFAPCLKILRHFGPNRAKEAEKFENYDIILVSYQTMRNDIDLLEGCFFSCIILDESQNIKNPDSRTFKSAKRLQTDFRLTLTGTPIENNTMELWAQMEFVNPGLLGSRAEFRDRFAKPIESGEGHDEAVILRKIIFPFILRRKKENVLKDLPEKEEIILYSEMGAYQREAYDRLKLRYGRKIAKTIEEKGINESSIVIFDALLRLRQMALFPSLADPDEEETASCKFDQLKEILPEILQEGHKVVLFSQFVSVLSILRVELEKQGINYSYIDGSTKDRAAEVHNFQNNPEKQIFLISLKAGGVGINLTAADYVILFDPWWNPAVEAQAIDRCHRFGQKNRVFAYRFIVKDTVEEKILLLQEHKRELMQQIVSEEKSFFKSLNKQDILQLFH